MVNIIDDDIWQSEPALRPEDEIILRKLHDMLQSTADDLKLLSGELSKFHEPQIQVKTKPMPLDEEFNEKVHIEELVNAKFHGYKIVDKPIRPPTFQAPDESKPIARNLAHSASSSITQPNFNARVNEPMKKPVICRNLSMTRPKTIAIDEKVEDSTKNKKQHNNKVRSKPSIIYNEFIYTYVEPEKTISTPQIKFTIQDMPRIDIRSELREQKVLQLDIIPDSKDIKETSTNRSNVAVVSMEHDTVSKQKPKTFPPSVSNVAINRLQLTCATKQPARKITKMSTCDSSGSTNNVSSDTLHNLKTQKHIKAVIRSSPKNSARTDRIKAKKTTINKKDTDLSTDAWKNKLNAVYGHPSTSKNSRTAYKSKVKNGPPKKFNLTPRIPVQRKLLNNTEYIPYSQLTLGGVRLSDIEREMSDIPNKNDITLSPLLDKILSSQENSPRKSEQKQKNKDKIFTTSDENLLEEVLNIERTVSKTIAKTVDVVKTQESSPAVSNKCKESDEKDSYADDFEEDKSENTKSQESKSLSNKSNSKKKIYTASNEDTSDTDIDVDDYDVNDNKPTSSKPKSNTHNKTYTKVSNLSFKNSVDVFEFVHSVDTQEIATQSNTTQKISLKETQTSPRNDKQSLQSIHNDLWPSVDPNGDVEKLFNLEKEFIKKLIIDEYGDILEKNITKSSTSRDVGEENKERNVSASQKKTQTSPAHVKSVMTSPTRTKTRTTSPFLSVTVDHQTSPMIIVTNDQELTVELDNDEEGISVNLSSPRFNLRLPQTSREILSNLEDCSIPAQAEQKYNSVKSNAFMKCNLVSSSSSIEGYNSSEISSLGEVRLKLKRKQKKRVSTISESSSTSTVSKYSSDLNSTGILPLRSEGELSMGQVGKKAVKKSTKSEGETSLGRSK